MFDFFLTYATAVKKAKAYADQITSSSAVRYKGTVNYFSDLPASAEVGDMYSVKYSGTSGTSPDGRRYVWGGYQGTNQWLLYPEVLDVKTADGTSLVLNGVAVIPDENINSAEGAHNLRYYNNTLQYYDGSKWVTLSLANLLL